MFALTSAQNNDGVEKLFRDIGNKFLDPNFQEKVIEAQKEYSPSFAIQKNEHIEQAEKKKEKCSDNISNYLINYSRKKKN